MTPRCCLSNQGGWKECLIETGTQGREEPLGRTMTLPALGLQASGASADRPGEEEVRQAALGLDPEWEGEIWAAEWHFLWEQQALLFGPNVLFELGRQWGLC